jgi:hypothetical protein
MDLAAGKSCEEAGDQVLGGGAGIGGVEGT